MNGSDFGQYYRRGRVAEPDARSVFRDMRASSPTKMVMTPPVSPSRFAAQPSPVEKRIFWPAVKYPDVDKLYHVGGSATLATAGVRCATSTPSSSPWNVQTGKPPGGWSVAGQMAEGW